jgi:hypothetical protein
VRLKNHSFFPAMSEQIYPEMIEAIAICMRNGILRLGAILTFSRTKMDKASQTGKNDKKPTRMPTICLSNEFPYFLPMILQSNHFVRI